MYTKYILLEGTQKDEEPVVRIQWEGKDTFLPLETAKEFAMLLLETAIAADNDWQYLNSIGDEKVPWETRREYIYLE